MLISNHDHITLNTRPIEKGLELLFYFFHITFFLITTYIKIFYKDTLKRFFKKVF